MVYLLMPLELIAHGETCNFYRNPDFPHLKFIERTDRFSIDDIVFPDEIPNKGIVLNQMSNYWMARLENVGVIQNPIIAKGASSLLKLGVDEVFAGRMIAVQDYIPIPLECIVRGYYVEESESWEAYRQHANMYGNVLPKGLKDSQKLPYPIYTPSTKGDINERDCNISFADSIDVMKKFFQNNICLTASEKKNLYELAFSAATSIRNTSMSAYNYAQNYALQKDIIIADAKLEFGVVIEGDGKRKLVIISEAFTPDTCRLWNTRTYKVGRPQPSLDKHIIKHYISENKTIGTMPKIPQTILDKTANIYWDTLKRLFDKDFYGVTSGLSWDWNSAQQDIII